MAKPSVTNIKPPSKTAVWVPPKTTWDLNDGADIISAGNSFAAEGSAQYDTLTDSINEPGPEAVNFGYEDYDYVFFGVNGGENETVRAMDSKAGVIVTGNGKDVITGERWVLNSDVTGKTVVYQTPADADLANYTYKSAGEMLVFAGNGSDYVHGGAANDILFGENGPDTLNGGADTGTASYVAADDGQIINPDNIFIWEEDPTGTSVARETSDNTVRKEGVFIDDGVIHTVFSYSPDEAGVHTIGYYKNGTSLDGPGDLDPDYFTTGDLVVGQKYYYSFVGDGDTVHVNVFVGDITPPQGPPGQWPVDSVATSQAIPTDYDITIIPGGNGTATFEAGDQLIGGNGPDQFVWNAADDSNVDLIWDYNQGDGGAVNPLEGDTLLLIGVTDTNADNVVDASDLTTFLFDVDNDPLTDDALVIYVGENQAIGLVGITDISQVNLVWG